MVRAAVLVLGIPGAFFFCGCTHHTVGIFPVLYGLEVMRDGIPQPVLPVLCPCLLPMALAAERKPAVCSNTSHFFLSAYRHFCISVYRWTLVGARGSRCAARSGPFLFESSAIKTPIVVRCVHPAALLCDETCHTVLKYNHRFD